MSTKSVDQLRIAHSTILVGLVVHKTSVTLVVATPMPRHPCVSTCTRET